MIVGSCPGCNGDVISGKGVRVDAEGRHWHPACRTNRTTKTEVGQEPAQTAPKRRGRPPKQRPPEQQ